MTEPTPDVSFEALGQELGITADLVIASAKSELAEAEALLVTAAEQDIIQNRTIRRLRRRIAELKGEEPPPEPEPGAVRYPGDRGLGKVSYGWDVEGSLAKVMGAEITRMSAIAPARDRTPTWCHKYSNVGENLWTSGGDCTWAAARGINIFINYSVWDPNHANRVNNGDFDSWIRQQAAAWKQAYERDGIYGAFAIGNEMDAPDKEWDNTASGRLAFRKAGMRIDRIFHEEGVTNVTQVTPPSIAQLYHGSGSTTDGGKFWAEYVPQLKPGVDWREWPDRFNPPKEAFDFTYPWILGINQYCWHPMNGYGRYDPMNGMWEPSWDIDYVLKHSMLSDDESKHGELANRVAKALNVPILISESGGVVWEKRSGADPAKTVQWWEAQHREYENSQVAIVLVWKQVGDGSDSVVKTSAQAFGGRLQQRSETVTSTNKDGDKGQPDPTNSKRKGYAAAFDLSGV